MLNAGAGIGVACNHATTRACYRLYSLSSVLAEDTREMLVACGAKLEEYLLAILRTLLKRPAFAPHAALVTRIAVHALDGVSDACCASALELALQAVAQDAPAAAHFVQALPVVLGRLMEDVGGDKGVLKAARARDAMARLCGYEWPGGLAHAILDALKRVTLSAPLAQQAADAALRACARAPAEHCAAIAAATLALASGDAAVQTLQALCDLMDRQRAAALAADDAQQLEAVTSSHAGVRVRIGAHLTRDKALVNGWLKHIKKGLPHSPAAFAVTACIVDIPRSSAAAKDAVKSALLAELKRADTVGASAWLQELLRSDGPSALRPVATTMLEAARGADATLAGQLLQLAHHLTAAGSLKAWDMADMASWGDARVQWWAASGGCAARLCLVGVSLQTLVRCCCPPATSPCCPDSLTPLQATGRIGV